MNIEYIKDIIDEIIYESIVGKNPFKEGDLVKLRPDVLRRHSQSVPAHAGYTKNEFSWRETLNKLIDKTGKITRVFPDSKHVNIEFPQSWKSKDEHGREYPVNTIGIDYTELMPAEKPDATNVEEGVGYVSDKDMAKDPKHIKGERWRIKFQSEDDLKKHGNTEKSSVNEVKAVIKELIKEMWTGLGEDMSGEYWHPLDNTKPPQIPTNEPKLSMAGEKKKEPVSKSGESSEELRTRLLAKLQGKSTNEAKRDRECPISYTLPKPRPDERPIDYLKKHFKNHPALQSFLKKHNLKKK